MIELNGVKVIQTAHDKLTKGTELLRITLAVYTLHHINAKIAEFLHYIDLFENLFGCRKYILGNDLHFF